MKQKKIMVDKVSKAFKISFRKKESFLERFSSVFSKKKSKKFLQALTDISFDVSEREILGLIGENGSGKSTLLRIIAGIYNKDNGKIRINGKIISLIGLGHGLKMRLTMRENIFVIASLFDLSKNQIKQRFNSIVEFAELEDFLDTKLYQFSEGMLQRLSFSIAIHCNPDILLLDEVFEVGDEDFKKKSAEKIKQLIKKGASAILVSHDMLMISKYCDRIVWLDKGEIKDIGKTKEVVKKYKKNVSEIKAKN